MNNYLRHAYPNELYRWGILGMKWGVRRYQNSDGTLTKAGKDRYNKGDKKNKGSETKDALKKKDLKKLINIQMVRFRCLNP